MPKSKNQQHAEMDEDDVYEMEDLKDYRIVNGVEQYKVKWRNYSMKQATWEPTDNILNPGEELQRRMISLKSAYAAKHQTKKNQKTDNERNEKFIEYNNQNEEQSDSKEDVSDHKSSDNKRQNSDSRDKRVSKRRNLRSSSILQDTSPKPKEPTKEPKQRDSTQRSSITTDDERPSIATNNDVQITLMRDEKEGRQVKLEYMIGKDKEQKTSWVSVEYARENHAQKLIDYLLSRVRFRDKTPNRQRVSSSGNIVSDMPVDGTDLHNSNNTAVSGE